MNEEWSQIAANAVAHAASLAGASIQEAASHYTLPHVTMRPIVFPDGDQWCALYGDNIQEGVCGFGDSPYAACSAFDKAWHEPIAARKP